MYIGNSPFTKASYNNVEVLATEGQTTFNVSYSPNFVDVLVNGVELSKTDYVAVNGTSIVLNEPLALNDVVVFKVWGTFQTADAVATGDVDQTIAGVKTFSSFPVTPSDAPTEEYQAVNKKYVDDGLYLHPSMTGSAALNGTTNNTVAMTDIVTKLGLEVGDVIRINMGAYNKLHTVESITNNNSIIVNYEHAGNRGNGSLKLLKATGWSTVTRVAKWFNAPIGLGQAWQDVTGSRVAGTTYTNTTGKPIQILVQYQDNSTSGGATFRVGSLSRTTSDLSGGSGKPYWFSAVIPSGVTYSISGWVSLPAWWELR